MGRGDFTASLNGSTGRRKELKSLRQDARHPPISSDPPKKRRERQYWNIVPNNLSKILRCWTMHLVKKN